MPSDRAHSNVNETLVNVFGHDPLANERMFEACLQLTGLTPEDPGR